MKRAAAAAISLMTGLAMLTGCSRAEVEETSSRWWQTLSKNPIQRQKQ